MSQQPVYRLAVYVPPEYVERVVAGVCGVDPLRYDRSAWWVGAGTEQYQPRPGATPSHSEVGKVSKVETTRLEFCIPRDPDLLRRVIDLGVRPHHPWQEPAILVDEAFADIRDGKEEGGDT